MKKVVRISLLMMLLLLTCFCLLACNGENNQSDQSDENLSVHTVQINSENLFDYYFSYNSVNSFLPNYNFGTTYGTKSSSTITITPKLKHFVDYHGYVVLKPQTDSQTKSEQVLKERRIQIEYCGLTTDVSELKNQTQQNDKTLSFDGIKYKFSSADMVVTYHHEGASGNKDLTYRSVSITKYNYSRYLTVDIAVNRMILYEETEIYQFDRTYSVSPTYGIIGDVEFNNVVLTFDNGTIIKLDAIGSATYQSTEYQTHPRMPTLSHIVGNIDFYPPATYTYDS